MLELSPRVVNLVLILLRHCAYCLCLLDLFSKLFLVASTNFVHQHNCNVECAYLHFNHVLKVLGAAMFYAKVGDAAMVYTGDYNMTPDRHLGAAQIDRMQLDLLITE